MRTKVLLGLAALAAGLSTSVAQNVYSLNVVGYVNVSLQANKLHFLSVPLAPTDGNFNITNTVVLGDSQAGANIYAWAGTAWSSDLPQWYAGVGWFPDMVIANGTGFFLASQAASTLTFVGEVPQGAITYNVPAGLSTLANKVPVGESFPGAAVGNAGDNMFLWDTANQKWSDTLWQYYAGVGWNAGGATDSTNGPVLNPADGVFYLNGGAAIPFTRNFTVQ